MLPVAEFKRIRRQNLPLSRVNLVRISLLAFTLFYFADVCLRASSKYFWYDEILTLYFSRLPNVSTLWAALHSGLESNPPAFHLLTRATEAVFGEGLIATRLPEIVAFWVMCLCIFKVVERRAGLKAGVIGMTLPMLTGAYYYAYEARPLIIVVAFASLALICWENAVLVGQRNRWFVGFSLALFAAFMFHCYAILLAIPFGLGELVRDIRNRRINWPFWIALAAPFIPAVFLYLPLMHAFSAVSKGTEFTGTFAAVWPQILKFYVFLIQPCSAIILVALVLFAFDRSNPPEYSPGADIPTRFTWHDIPVLVGFLALPAIGVVFAQVLHTAFFSRYFLAALLGIAIPFAILAGVRSHRPWVARVILILIFCALALDFARLLRHRLSGTGEILVEPSTLTPLDTTPGQPLYLHPLVGQMRSDSSVPITVLHPLDFLYLLQYAPDLAPRLYFLHSSEQDLSFRALREFLPWSPVKYNQVALGSSFAASHKTFYVYSDVGHLEEFYRITRFLNIRLFKAEEQHFLAKVQAGPQS